MQKTSLSSVCLLLTLLGFIGLVACAGHEAYVSSASGNDGTEPMTAGEARRVLGQLARLHFHIFYLRDGDRRITDTYISVVHTKFSAIYIQTTKDETEFKLPLTRLEHLNCEGREAGAISSGVLSCHSDDGLSFYFEWDEDVPELSKRLWSAIQVLQKEAQQFFSPTNEKQFQQALQRQRTAKSVSQVPNGEMERLMGRAEAAVKDKDYVDAAELYLKAGEIEPAWPTSHFNAALVLSELGEYEFAIREMNRYLALVPGAPNAHAAQQRIYEWEHKVSEQI